MPPVNKKTHGIRPWAVVTRIGFEFGPNVLFGHTAGNGGTEAIGSRAGSTNREDGDGQTRAPGVVDLVPAVWQDSERGFVSGNAG